MPVFPGVKAALKRGSLIAAANWPVVVVQFVAEATFKMMIGVPLVGGALLVALVIGGDLSDLLSGEVREIVGRVAAGLVARPVALFSFLLSFTIVLLGGSILMFLLKGGTVNVLVAAEWSAPPGIEHAPLRASLLRRVSQFSVARFLDGCERFFRRYLRLGLTLLGIYAVSGAIYLAALYAGYLLIGDDPMGGGTVVAAICSAGLVAWITIVNLLYLLVQMIIAVENRSVRWAARCVFQFLRSRFKDITLAFLIVLTLVLMATAASIVATTGLSLIAFVPVMGLAVLPLQVAAWLLRGLIFQYLGLSALAAYLSLYRATTAAAPDIVAPAYPSRVRTA
jgi:hypothetical protein